MKAPCYGCADRRIGCHADCEQYKAFRAERDEAIAQRVSKADVYHSNGYWRNLLAQQKRRKEKGN